MNLAQKVGEHILQYAETHWKEFIDEDGTILWDEDAAILRALETLIDDIADELRDNSVVINAVIDARIAVQEAAEDAKAWGTMTHDHMRYYGLSEKDFV